MPSETNNPWADGMNEHDQLREAAITIRRLTVENETWGRVVVLASLLPDDLTVETLPTLDREQQSTLVDLVQAVKAAYDKRGASASE